MYGWSLTRGPKRSTRWKNTRFFALPTAERTRIERVEVRERSGTGDPLICSNAAKHPSRSHVGGAALPGIEEQVEEHTRRDQQHT